MSSLPRRLYRTGSTSLMKDIAVSSVTGLMLVLRRLSEFELNSGHTIRPEALIDTATVPVPPPKPVDVGLR